MTTFCLGWQTRREKSHFWREREGHRLKENATSASGGGGSSTVDDGKIFVEAGTSQTNEDDRLRTSV